MKGMPKRQFLFRSILKSLTKRLTCLGNRCSVTISNRSYNFEKIFGTIFRMINLTLTLIRYPAATTHNLWAIRRTISIRYRTIRTIDRTR